MMDIQKLLDDLELINEVTPDYSAGRRKGLTDTESETVVTEAITKAIETIEALQEQNEVLGDTVDMLSPLMMENRELKEKQIPKPPQLKKHPRFPDLVIFYFCKCGQVQPGWGIKGAETNYCGNCGQRLKEMS